MKIKVVRLIYKSLKYVIFISVNCSAYAKASW